MWSYGMKFKVQNKVWSSEWNEWGYTGCSKLVFILSNGYYSKTKTCTMWNNTPQKSEKYALLRNINSIWE